MGAWRSHYHRTRAEDLRQDFALEEAGLGQRHSCRKVRLCWEEGHMWQNLALELDKLLVCRGGSLGV